MTLLGRVLRILDREKVPHALIGAAALAANGVSRSTFDLDLLAVESRCLDENLWAGLRAEGVSVDVRRGDDNDPLMGIVRCDVPGERPVDIVVGRHTWQAEALSRAVRSGFGAPVVTAVDLVLLTLHAGGPQDLWDIRQLLEATDRKSLAAQVDQGVERLDAEARRSWITVRDSVR
jgi:hypothetical protein